jgi:hypothetical protein
VTLDAVHLSPGDYTGAVHFDLQYPGGVLDVPFDFVVNGDPAVGVPPAPHPGLALRGFAPNPLRRHAGGVRLAYTLPGPGRATITLVDVRGRIAWRRELARTAAGPGVVTLDAAALATLSPGIVWARLEQGGRVTTTRGVILP